MKQNEFLKPTPILNLKSSAVTIGKFEADLLKLIEENQIRVVNDYAGNPAIALNALKTLSRIKKTNEMRAERFTEKSKYIEINEHEDIKLKLQRRYSFLIGFLEAKIGRLEDIFNQLYQKVEQKQEESALSAAMMLYSKCIALSNVLIGILKNNQWHIGSIIREIMECHSLAQYFYNNKDDGCIQDEIYDWFRLEKIPKPIKIRTKSAEFYSIQFKGTTPQYHFDLESDLYNKKSKFVHSSFMAIAETAEFRRGKSAIPNRLNLGRDYKLNNLVEVAEMACGGIQTIFSTFASLIHRSGLNRAELFEELRKIDSEFNSINW